MFFDSVSLKKNSWHYKLQKFVLNQVPFKNNFCPYFWTTVFCAFAFPFVALAKGARLAALGCLFLLAFPFAMLYSLVDKLADFIETRICAPFNNKRLKEYVDSMSDEDAYYLAAAVYTDHAFTDSLYTLIQRIKDSCFSSAFEDNYKLGKLRLARLEEWRSRAGDNWEDRLRKARKSYLKRLQEEEKARAKLAAEAEAAAQRRKAFFNGLVKYTKYLVLLAMGVVLVELLYWLAVFVLFIVESWASIAEFFSWCGSGLWWLITSGGPWLVLAVVGIALIYGLVLLVGKMLSKCMWLTPKDKPGVLKRTGKKLSNGLGFFTMYIKTFKENNCPAIKWEEDV